MCKDKTIQNFSNAINSQNGTKLSQTVIVLGTFPIDTTKIRLQVQGQKLDANHATLKYRGMVDCFVKIWQQEGFRALYAGYVPQTKKSPTLPILG